MIRANPNQDINDLTFLEDLRMISEEIAVRVNDYDQINNGITIEKAISPLVHPDNTRAIPISTLLTKQDGSTVAIDGFKTSGTYTQENIDLYNE